jgi:uncharacterized protein involved in outer membrane biogenesis
MLARPSQGDKVLRKIAIGLGLLAVLVLAILLAGPRLIDLEDVKARIAAAVEARTGRHLEIAGPLQLALLPTPSISARGVRLANPPGASVPDMLRLRLIEVKLALWPLFTGAIEIRGATLVDADLDLERLPGGTANWTVQGGAWRGLVPRSVTIQNGNIAYHSGARTERLEHIAAELALAEPDGVLRGEGELVARGASVTVTASAQPGAGDTVPFQVAIATRPAGRIELEGTVAGALDAPEVDGRIKASTVDFARLVGTIGRIALPSALAVPCQLSGTLTAKGNRVAIDDTTIDFGPARATGRLALTRGARPSLEVGLRSRTLNLDHWPSVPYADDSAVRLALPESVDAELSLAFDDMIWRGGVMRGGALKASLAGGRLAITRLAGSLPGGLQAAAKGTLTTPAAGPQFDGEIDVDAADLRGFLAWTGVALDEVPADRLRRASLTAKLALAADHVDVSSSDATIDATKLRFAATVLLHRPTAFGLRLAADAINLDAYWPPQMEPAAALALLAGVDANIDAQVGELTWRGQVLRKLHGAGRLESGNLQLQDLSAGDLGGAAVKLTGEVLSLGTPGQKALLAVELKGPELERFLRTVRSDLDLSIGLGAFAFTGSLQDDAGKLAAGGELQLLGGHAHIAADWGPSPEAAAITVAADHPHADALLSRLLPGYRPAGGDLGALTLSGHAAVEADKITLDSLSLAIGGSTASGRIAVALKTPRPSVSAELQLGDWAVDRFLPAGEAAARLLPGVVLAAAGQADVPGMGWSETPLDLGALRLFDGSVTVTAQGLSYGASRLGQATVALAVTDGTAELTRLDGTLFGGRIDATGRLAAAGNATELRLTLADADLKAALGALGVTTVDGKLGLTAELTTNGTAPGDLVAHLAGDAAVTARDGSIAGLNLAGLTQSAAAESPTPPDAPSLAAAALNGTTRFSAVSGSFRLTDGVARSEDLRLAGEAGEVTGKAEIDLGGSRIAAELAVRLAGLAGAPPLALSVVGPLDAPHALLDAVPLSEFLSHRVAPPEPAAEPSSPER